LQTKIICKQRTLNGLIAVGLIIIVLVLKLKIIPIPFNDYKINEIVVNFIQYLLMAPCIYFAILTIFPRKLMDIAPLTIAIVMYVIVSNFPDEWIMIIYKTTATIIGSLSIWLFRHKLHNTTK